MKIAGRIIGGILTVSGAVIAYLLFTDGEHEPQVDTVRHIKTLGG